jgi:hypothetical protein
MNQQEEAIAIARQIQDRPDIVPWRIIERNLVFPGARRLCPKGEHKCEWNAPKTVLRCAQCGLDCT